ncbi:MAG: FAD-binding oxidoreductase [Pseudomonadota bacterium]
MIDFLVIGGGIAGISAAARLAPHGAVTVLEAERHLGYHASGRSAAMFEEMYGSPATITLNRASRAYHRAGGYLSDRGMMLIGTRENRAAFDTDLSAMRLDEISVDEARRMVPVLNAEIVTRVGYHAAAWDIDTDRLIQDFARVIRRNGGAIRTGMRVASLTRTKSGWRAQAGEQVFQAHLIVNAAGAWADRIAGMAGIMPLRMQPYRRSMARIPAPGELNVSRWPMLLGPGEDWYAKPDAGALLVSPAEEDPLDPQDVWADDMVIAEGVAKYEARVTEPVTRILSNWAGLRTFAPDRRLVLGPDPSEPRFVWCAGQGGYGMQTAPAASQLLADLVLGRRSELPADIVLALSPRRFRK